MIDLTAPINERLCCKGAVGHDISHHLAQIVDAERIWLESKKHLPKLLNLLPAVIVLEVGLVIIIVFELDLRRLCLS
jgi:hypothetical protein